MRSPKLNAEMHNLSLTLPLRFLLYFFILILLYCIYVSAKQGIADVVSYNAKSMMNQWASSRVVVNDKNWQDAKKSLLSALEYEPNNPEYLSLMGNLYEWRVVGKIASISEDEKNYRIALDYYRLALKKRPIFAFSWANVAVVKSILKEIDDEYYQSIERSLILGAWEPGVQLKIADATLSVWYLLNESGWDNMLMNIEKGLLANPKVIFAMAKKYQVFNQLCGKLRRTDVMLTYCQS